MPDPFESVPATQPTSFPEATRTLHVFVTLDNSNEFAEIGKGQISLKPDGELEAMLDMVAVLRQVADDVLSQHTAEAARVAKETDRG